MEYIFLKCLFNIIVHHRKIKIRNSNRHTRWVCSEYGDYTETVFINSDLYGCVRDVDHHWDSRYIFRPRAKGTLSTTGVALWTPDLTHCGRVTHVCVNELTFPGSDNGLSPISRETVIWTNAGIPLFVTWIHGNKFQWNLIRNLYISI